MGEKSLLRAGTMGALGFVALLGGSLSSQAQTPSEVSPINPPIVNCNSNNLNNPDSGLVTSVVPCAPNFVNVTGLDSLQHNFDFYSWLTFVALNWPAEGSAPIGKGPRPGGDARTKWEDVTDFRQLSDVMLPNGQRPTWGARVVPAECRSKDGPGKMVIHLIEEAFDQPFRSGPLIDQNGNYALFDILMNKPMFDYIVDNTLYSRAGQRLFTQGRFDGSPDAPSQSPGVPPTPPLGIVNFPKGSQPADGNPGTMGALMLKVSWKVLSNGEDPARFHTVDGLVYTAPKNGKPGSCVEKKLGLVGFHAAHKTNDAPQWIWTTFEHVANAPEQQDVENNKVAGRKFNFYDPACGDGKCPVNQTPPQPWDPQVEPFPNGYKSQVVRIPLPPEVSAGARALNDRFHGLDGVKGTVWQNYMLVSTQWPTDAANKVDPTGVPAPTYLANTTLETYSQGDTPLSSSSCMACHNNATTHHVPAVASDFTFTLEKAQ